MNYDTPKPGIYTSNPSDLFFAGVDRHHFMGQIFQNMGPQLGSTWWGFINPVFTLVSKLGYNPI